MTPSDIPPAYVTPHDVARRAGLSRRRVLEILAALGVVRGRTPLGYLWSPEEAEEILAVLRDYQRGHPRGRPKGKKP